MPRILVVDDSAINLKLIAAALTPTGYDVVTASSGREALERAPAVQPDLIILDVIMPDLNGYDVCRQLRRSPSVMHLPILMLTGNNSLDERINGFEAGADDYMSKPFAAPELQARVRALLRRALPSEAIPSAPIARGRVIAVFSLRGGVGVSSMAANLAVGLSQIWERPAALLDLALTSGQAALLLNLPLRHSWADLAHHEVTELDATMLESAMLSHPSGVRVLAAPSRPEQSELISGERVKHVIELCQERYDYVILDLPHDFSETTLAALDASDQIVLLMTPDLASLRTTTCALEVFQNLDYPSERIMTVLNTTFERGGLAQKDIELAIKRPLNLILPFAPEPLASAINRGVPPVYDSAKSSIGAVLEDCAFIVSREEQRRQRPAQPSDAWQRVAQRMQQRRQRAS